MYTPNDMEALPKSDHIKFHWLSLGFAYEYLRTG